VGRESNFTPEQRRDIVLSLLEGRVPMAELCRTHQVSNTAIYRWKDQFLEGGLAALQGQGASTRERAMQAEMDEMRTIVGELALANYAMKRGRAAWTGKKGGRGADG
jgi:transposase-like protein